MKRKKERKKERKKKKKSYYEYIKKGKKNEKEKERISFPVFGSGFLLCVWRILIFPLVRSWKAKIWNKQIRPPLKKINKCTTKNIQNKNLAID